MECPSGTCVQSPPGVCGLVLERVANTGAVWASGENSRIGLLFFKVFVLFSQGFAHIGKDTYPLSLGLQVCKMFVLWGVLKIKPISTHCEILGRKMLEKCKA